MLRDPEKAPRDPGVSASEGEETGDRWALQWELFHGAAEAEDRVAWLRENCADEGLRSRVAELLAAADQAEGFLPTDGVGLRKKLGASRELTPGDQVGRYRLLKSLGEGGMGRVFLAQESEPLERQVALKVIRRGFENQELIARFEIERQVLARLSHPNVAGVFDAGLVEEGRPFFVMEAVDGEPIDAFCARHRVSAEDRIRLMITICGAVQHAHHKGIIHRDLKPSNVLVAEIDGSPIAKVIDFGIAKLLGPEPATPSPPPGRSAAAAFKTRHGRLLGTPEFMSPEQIAEAGTADIDSRTDVFALGVMLSYLLTGGPPPKEESSTLAMPGEPAASEGGILTTGGRDGRDGRDRREGRAKGVSRELAWIIERATTVDRGERYASCSELAADLQRYLDHLPVLAGPDSYRYRVGKLMTRHRLAATVLGGALLVLLLLTAVLAFQTARLDAALDAASAEARRRGQVSEILVDLFRVADPEVAPALPRTAREVLDAGADRLLEDLEDPHVYLPLVRALGTIYGNLGEYERQVEMYRAAVKSQLALGSDSLELAETLDRLGVAQTKAGRWEAAETSLRNALDRRLEALGPDHPSTLATRREVASLYFQNGRRREAEPILLDVLARHRRAGRAETLAAAEVLNTLGNVRYTMEDYSAARRHFARERVILEAHLPADDRRIAASIDGLARVFERLRLNEEAEVLYRQILGARSAKLGVDHPEIAAYQANLALVLTRQRRFEEAREASAAAARTFESSFGPNHPKTLQAQSNHAVILSFAGDAEASIELLREIQGRMESFMDLGNSELRANLASQGSRLISLGRWQEALEPFRRLLDHYEQTETPDVIQARQMAHYGTALSQLGRTEEGRRFLESALEIQLRAYGPADRRTRETWKQLEQNLQGAGGGVPLEAWRARLDAPKLPGEAPDASSHDLDPQV